MHCKVILPPQTIGIIGGGQLGRMLSFAAKQMGYRVIILDPKTNGPAAQVSDYHIQAAFDDQEALKQLYTLSDVITYEFENIPHGALEPFIDKIPQGTFPLKFTQDRLIEKQTIENAGFKTAPYIKIDDLEDVKAACVLLGYPLLLKTRTGGYDGKGQQRIKSSKDSVELLGPSILEKVIDLDQEVSLIVTRSIQNTLKNFPIIDNIHLSQRLVESSVPTTLHQDMIQKIYDIGRSFAQKIDLIGTLAIEFFITKEQEILINECAPRVHNSGHLTIEACEVSQFEQHIRAITGLPLKETTLMHPALMVNIYGQDFEKAMCLLKEEDSMHVHLYGKKNMKKNRKVGHITICHENLDSLEINRKLLRNRLNKDV